MQSTSRVCACAFAALVLAVPASAALTPTQAAALSVFQFELTQDGVHKAQLAGDEQRSVSLKRGPVQLPETFLATLWPYSLGVPSGAGPRPASEPPFGRLMFPDSIPDLKAKNGVYKNVEFVIQFNRTLGSLMGAAPHPNYVDSSRLAPADCGAVAREMKRLYGGSTTTWEQAITRAQPGLDSFVERAAGTLEKHLADFIAALEKGPSSSTDEKNAKIRATMARVKKDPVAEYNRLLRRPQGGSRIDYERIAALRGELDRLVQELTPTPRR